MPTPKQRAAKRASPSAKSSAAPTKPRAGAPKKPAAPTRQTAGKPAARPAKVAAAKKPGGKPAKPAAGKPGPRADFGKPIAGFFAKQPAALRPLLEELRDLVQDAAPDATSSIKWGMPFFTIDGGILCALGGHKGHVNLILSGPPGTYADPDNLLRGDGKTGRHLKLVAGDRVPRDAVRGWLATAAERARRKA